jgi:glycerophosphoryl diester phosphodiesterase
MNAGYAYIETDPQLTKDGKVVLMHDETVNRTCRNADGSVIEKPIRVCDVTYDELMQYDAGIALGEQFRGTRVPLLDELLALADGTDIIIALDKRITCEQIDTLLDVVERHSAKVCFSTSTVERIRCIQKRIPDAMFDYDVNLEDEALAEVCKLVKPENLIVWMYMDKPNFAWLAEKAKVSPENYARVKKYARVGIANVNTPIDVYEALAYQPDVLEV